VGQDNLQKMFGEKAMSETKEPRRWTLNDGLISWSYGRVKVVEESALDAANAEISHLRKAVKEFDNDNNWILATDHVDRETRTGRTDFVFVGMYDPRVLATAALDGRPFNNTPHDFERKLSDFYTPKESITKLFLEKEKLKHENKDLQSQLTAANAKVEIAVGALTEIQNCNCNCNSEENATDALELIQAPQTEEK
jgi:uncharacterized protein YbaA (DUF1428 family)